MPNEDRDLALGASDDAFKDAVKKIAAVLLEALATEKTDADRDQAKLRFQNALKLYQDAHQELRALLGRTDQTT